MAKRKKDLADRRKSATVELSKQSAEQADQIGFEVGKKLGLIVANAKLEIDKILNTYTQDGLPLKAELTYTLLDPKTGKPLEL